MKYKEMFDIIQKNKDKKRFDYREFSYMDGDLTIICFVPISCRSQFPLGKNRSLINPWSSHERNLKDYQQEFFHKLPTYRIKGTQGGNELVGVNFVTESPFIMKVPRYSNIRHWIPYKGKREEGIWKLTEKLLRIANQITEEDIVQNKLGNYLCSILD